MILSTIKSYLMAGMAVFILASCGWAFYERYQAAQTRVELATEKANTVVERTRGDKLQGALKASEDQRKIAEEAISQRDKALAKLAELKEASDAKLRNVLRQNRTWADTAVPGGLRDAITGCGGKTNPCPTPVKPN